MTKRAFKLHVLLLGESLAETTMDGTCPSCLLLLDESRSHSRVRTSESATTPRSTTSTAPRKTPCQLLSHGRELLRVQWLAHEAARLERAPCAWEGWSANPRGPCSQGHLSPSFPMTSSLEPIPRFVHKVEPDGGTHR